jgi:abhydrolase domain-containing protein 12
LNLVHAGNAATRAFSARIQHYTAFSSRLSANILAIDYRGFGDSTGAPTQPGVARDARAAWNWLIKNGAPADQILIVGHSLGTAVSALLAAELSDEDISPKGVVLLSPFSSISKLLETYSILGVVPLMKPLATIPWVASASSFSASLQATVTTNRIRITQGHPHIRDRHPCPCMS